MLQEYAIDPRVAADFNNLIRISLLFDFGNPRRISRFPKTWEAMVHDEAGRRGDTNKKNVEIKLIQLKGQKKCLQGFSRPYDLPGDNWHEKALASHNTLRQFEAIICDEDNQNFLSAEDLDDAHPKFSGNNRLSISKTMDDFLDAFRPVLQTAKYFYFVDPYFAPTNPYCSRLFNRFFELLNLRPDAANISIYICGSCGRPDPRPDREYHAGEEPKLLHDIIQHMRPDDLHEKLNVFLRPHQGNPDGDADKMHPRYLFTDIASFSLDSSFNVDPRAQLKITMIDKTEHDREKEKYFFEGG